ncbi:hypothetical protein BH09MYX1_BH09MYX1_47330 [soil metagenome]
MGTDRARQKKLEKQKKKRVQLRANGPTKGRNEAQKMLLARAAHGTVGEAWASVEWREKAPALITVVISRKLQDGSLIAGVALVDRTSVGVKNGQLRGPLRGKEVDALMAQLGRINPRGMEVVSERTARSIIHHAAAYARTLGFEPHPDFPWSLLGSADDLEDTPLAKPERPLYIAEPDDNAPEILATLEAAVGEGNYDVHVPEDAYDTLAMVLDRWSIGKGADGEGILAILATLEGAHRVEGGEGVALRRNGSISSAHVEDGALLVLSGSDEAAATVRRDVESVLGDKVRFDRREGLSGKDALTRLASAGRPDAVEDDTE